MSIINNVNAVEIKTLRLRMVKMYTIYKMNVEVRFCWFYFFFFVFIQRYYSQNNNLFLLLLLEIALHTIILYNFDYLLLSRTIDSDNSNKICSMKTKMRSANIEIRGRKWLRTNKKKTIEMNIWFECKERCCRYWLCKWRQC